MYLRIHMWTDKHSHGNHAWSHPMMATIVDDHAVSPDCVGSSPSKVQFVRRASISLVYKYAVIIVRQTKFSSATGLLNSVLEPCYSPCSGHTCNAKKAYSYCRHILLQHSHYSTGNCLLRLYFVCPTEVANMLSAEHTACPTFK